MTKVKRGRFIVLEGIDRSGKSSCSQHLNASLQSLKIPTKLISFPNRSTPTGKLLNDFLKTHTQEPSAKMTHLLFSANRYEDLAMMQALLESGVSLVCDRYLYSGAAYSFANGLDLTWCLMCDDGLMKPDCVIYIDVLPEVASKRGEWGEERYEVLEFQEKVYDAYKVLSGCDDVEWVVVDGTKAKEQVAEIVLQECLRVLNSTEDVNSLVNKV